MSNRRFVVLYLVAILSAVIVVAVAWFLSTPQPFDLIIRNGDVIDGTGGGIRWDDDLYVRNGKIVRRGSLRRRSEAPIVIDATGLVVAPGFIDAHTHIEQNLPEGESSQPFTAENFVLQGVTTVITGNCGTSVLDIADLRDRLESAGSQINVATLVGHNSIRREVVGRDQSRAPTEHELHEMRGYVERALRDGALGVSTGLGYAPGRFASLEEVIEVVSPLREFGGIYATHLRSEGRGARVALAEAAVVANVLEVPLHVCHIKAAGRSQWGQLTEHLRQLSRTTPEFTVDVYPYDASSTDLQPLLPTWFLGYTAGQKRAFLETEANEERLKASMTEIVMAAGWEDYSFVQVAWFGEREAFNGRTISEIALGRVGEDKGGYLNAQQDVIIEMATRGYAQMVYHEMDPRDVRVAVSQANAMIGSDSGVRDFASDSRPHPRGLGTFPRVIDLFVNKQHAISMVEAIRKMTSLPAETFGLNGRGRIQDGFDADMVLFDPELIRDNATYSHPLERPGGIEYVLVGGEPVVWKREITNRLPGVFLPSAASVKPEERGKRQ